MWKGEKDLSFKFIAFNIFELCVWYFLKLWIHVYLHYFLLNYILLTMLLQLSWFSPRCPLPLSTPYSLRQFPHHCSWPWVMCISYLATPFPIRYFTSPWLFCNYLFVLLNPLTSSPIPPHPPFPSGNHQNALWIFGSLSVLLVCLICFLDAIVDR